MIIKENDHFCGQYVGQFMKTISKWSPKRLNIFFRFSFRGRELVLIKWLFNGHKLEERVPLADARHRKYELESQGAVVYWSERTFG